jgi:acyl carrier protein
MTSALSARIEHRIRYTITQEFQIPQYLLHSETVFRDDLGFDESDMLFLALALEDEFEFLLTEDFKVEEMRDLIKLVIANLQLNPLPTA